jgi:hypothetical protein
MGRTLFRERKATGLHEPELQRAPQGLGAALGIELAKQVGNMELDRALAQAQTQRDLLVRLPLASSPSTSRSRNVRRGSHPAAGVSFT